MKIKVFLSLLALAMAILACGPTTTVTSQPPQNQPTNPPVEVQPTTPPQATTAPSAQDFFTEDFNDSSSSNLWTYYVTGPNHDKYGDTVTTKINNGYLEVNIPQTQLYVYLMYEPYTYTNVALSMQAENRGANTNNVSLICRYNSTDNTWYEFSVGSGGDWYLYAYKDGYNTLYNGGSTDLKQGKTVNKYGLTCNDNKLYLYINDKQVKGSPITDTQYVLKDGQIGFNISSLDILNVDVDIDWIKVAQP